MTCRCAASPTAFAATTINAGVSPSLATQFIDVRVRYKRPGSATSIEVVKQVPLSSLVVDFNDASDDLRFAAAVTEFAEILRESPFSEGERFDDVRAMAEAALGGEAANRTEFLDLVLKARDIWSGATQPAPAE